MTRRLLAAIFFTLACVCAATGQESPTSSPSTTPGESPSPVVSPEGSIAAPPAPAQMPSASPARSVRISFLPPPLEGTISLGIYDANGKLVRVLHQEAQLNEFEIGPDALITRWDGKNDHDEDLPAGKYYARGYVVGNLRAEPMNNSTPPPDATTADVRITLIPNPLANNQRQTISLGIAFDDENSFLQTKDGLPLFTVDEKPNLIRASIKKSGGKSIDVWTQDAKGPIVLFHVSNLDKMMAFDCGEFQLK